MTCKDLFGYQLVSICNTHIVIQNNTGRYVLAIEEDNGGCCGYNEVVTNLLISETELQNNPIITKVEVERDSEGDREIAKITFFGVYKPLATVGTVSSSGSGWCYGACVSIKCKALDINEIVSCW